MINERIFGKSFSDKRLDSTKKKNNVYTKIKSIVFSSNYYKFIFKEGENNRKKFFHILTIKNNPKYADFRWLNSLFNIEDITIVNKLKTNNIKEAKTYINSTTRYLKLKFDNQSKADLIEENQTLNYYELMAETAEWISNGNCTLMDSEMFIIVSADKKRALDKKVGLLREICNSYKIKLDTLKFLQKDAFLEMVGK